MSWHQVAESALAGTPPSQSTAAAILNAPLSETLSLLDAAYQVRRHYFGNKVHIHVLDNAKKGACPEDCGFCSQSSKYGSPSGQDSMKSADDLVSAARVAHLSRAKRFCMVTATRGPSSKDLDTICEAAERIKSEMNIELCASLGLLTEAKAKRLKDAGIDRFNHNLETSQRHFDKIVSTHQWADRVKTIELAKAAGMETCCGGIVGLGEGQQDIIDLAFSLRELDVDSVPVNFLDARPGTPLEEYPQVNPQLALRALCLFRFVHPRADLRVAGGRELTLRSLQAMALYPANSLFSNGYLTTGGAEAKGDWQMIEDLGFEIEFAGPKGLPTHPEKQPASVRA